MIIFKINNSAFRFRLSQKLFSCQEPVKLIQMPYYSNTRHNFFLIKIQLDMNFLINA